MAKNSSVQCKKHKDADYKSAAQVGEDRGELYGHSGQLYSCALCGVLLCQVGFDIQFYCFLRTNIVLDTRGNVHFAGMYQKVSSSAWAAAGVWQKRSHFID